MPKNRNHSHPSNLINVPVCHKFIELWQACPEELKGMLERVLRNKKTAAAVLVEKLKKRNYCTYGIFIGTNSQESIGFRSAR